MYRHTVGDQCVLHAERHVWVNLLDLGSALTPGAISFTAEKHLVTGSRAWIVLEYFRLCFTEILQDFVLSTLPGDATSLRRGDCREPGLRSKHFLCTWN